MLKRLFLFSLLLFSVSISHAQINLTNGLVAYYPFIGNANDASGNGNNATIINATLATDHYGNANSAYYFDGQASYIQVPASPTLNISGPMTIYAYFKPQGFFYGPCHGNGIVDKGNDFSPAHYAIRFDDNLYTSGQNCANSFIDSIHQLTYGIRGTASAPPTAYTPYLSKTQWVCVVMVQDQTTLKFYVNGVLVGTTNNPVSGLSTDNSPLLMGRYNASNYPYWFKGIIDEVRIYNRALNALEVDSLCNLAYTVANPPTIINKYAAVTGRVPCDNTFSVDTATGFNAGDTVLMVQMKGATIDSSNTASFGNVTAINGAGNYEYNIIKSVAGNNITLRYKVKRQYDIPNGRVQFVRVANFQNYTVSTPHTAMAWTGTKGGVFIANVAGTLTLNNSIDVSGEGFKGAVNNIISNNTQICNITDYYLPPNVDSGGLKAEGITNISLSKSYGRGKLANGGGGGDAHNAGAGGGGNGGAGGIGGYQFSGCVANPTTNTTGGIGGVALTYSNAANKIFLGGGGGTTQANGGTDASGGNGGGIIIINAGTIVGNGNLVSAKGDDARGCINTGAFGICHDGMGGGGAGGTVLLKSTSITGTLNALATGGRGGDESANASYGSVGPGGGGGGGVLWVSQATTPANISLTNTGGVNGVTVFNSAAWGAQAGATGTSLTSLQLALPAIIDTFKQNTIAVAFTDSNAGCTIRKFLNGTTTTTTGVATYTWNFGSGNTSNLLNPTFNFPGNGTYPVKLIVIDSNGCKDSLTKNIIITSPRFVNAGNDTNTCLGVAVSLHASGAASYTWQPDATLSGNFNASTILASPTALTTSYIIEGIDANGCLDRDTVVVTLVPGMAVVASPQQLSNCKGNTVQLMASGVASYMWSPATNLSAANIANPIATVAGNMQYVVTGRDTKGCISFDTVDVIETPGPQVHAYADGDGVSCYARAIQLHATGALSYQWHPGAYLNDSTIAAPTAIPPRTTVFTVIGKDAAGCSGTDTITVASYATAVVYLPNAFTPNGDHINDDIRPIIFCDFKLDKWEVFNRWGQSVYQGYNLNKGWDGSFNGEPAPLGVYMYYVRGKNDDGQSVLYKGNITLLR